MYREKMGKFSEEFKRVSLDVISAVVESLGINPTNLIEKFKEGMDVVTVNCYPPCPQPELALGLPPHTDFGCLTILHQSDHGLEIYDEEDKIWKAVPAVPGALQVNIGDQFEGYSNGLYKSVLHRATLNNVKTRVSIAVLYSLAVDEQVHTAEELIDDEHPRKYKPSCLREFLNFLSQTDVASTGKSYGQTLKIDFEEK
ncbi:putative flavanone 3-dioxygenase [Lupinus albus]|uniref:Putative flavanone 3-dioxygenase n=1 Tax=Lupinus albus TaxID=3870 RepID=A0A6A4NT99_LUPAL|nr:putative flavanone 3-dioxygenase [Lupinus albus]